jgi:hypothetical protein
MNTVQRIAKNTGALLVSQGTGFRDRFNPLHTAFGAASQIVFCGLCGNASGVDACGKT